MSKQYDQVITFNCDILGIESRELGMQESEELGLSLHQLREEIDEFETACATNDFIGAIDAIHDLQYFMYGIMYKMGITPTKHEQIFTAIHSANMGKCLGKKAGREGYDAADAIKPKNWVAPETAIMRILEQK